MCIRDRSDTDEDLEELEGAWQYAYPPPLVTRSDQAQPQTQEQEENVTNFMENHPQPVHVIPEEEENALATINDQAELLQWHHQLNHPSFAKLHLLSLVGILPKRLSTIRSPKCAGCVYSTMTKRPWHIKTNQDPRKIKPAKEPGDCVSVDQLESSTPGFVVQLKGILTKRRYHAATVFIDHFSNVTYIY
eukprot:11748311-Ditylum_brightwellii.AAC.1